MDETIRGQGDQQALPVETAWKVIPAFQSRNINATVEFYTQVLGLTLGGLYNHDNSNAADDSAPPPEATFCSVFAGHKAAANIYFFKPKNDDEFQPSAAMIALGTRQVDDLYNKVLATGSNKVRIVDPIADKPWGYRQFAMLDNEGNRLTFFRFLEGGNPGGI
ncbi:Fc.00g010870.m01.CDS01 [Cosmosporella sp. VM-42]